MSVYRSVEVQLDSSKNVVRGQVTSTISDLPVNDLLIQVKYTALNFVDALVLSGKFPFAKYPIVPGIDAAGIVISSKSPEFSPGDEVIVTGFDMGIKIAGGLGGYVSVPAGWALHMPIGLNMKLATALGTAGITAAIAISDLENTGITGDKRIAVTGASCDLGAVGAALLAAHGYKVTAYVPDAYAKDFMISMDIHDVKYLSALDEDVSSELKTPLYDGAFDTVGGTALSSLLRYMSPNATVVLGAARENARLDISVHPFLYRGINVIGINSIDCPLKVKSAMWQRLSGDLMTPYVDWMCTEISVDEIEQYIPLLLQGHLKGRVVVNHGI